MVVLVRDTCFPADTMHRPSDGALCRCRVARAVQQCCQGDGALVQGRLPEEARLRARLLKDVPLRPVLQRGGLQEKGRLPLQVQAAEERGRLLTQDARGRQCPVH